jgi:uncharacterized protein YjbI with pentapeptide repeats
MADRENFYRLKAVTVWNAWRHADPADRPRLTRLLLTRVYLLRFAMTGAKLRGANLTWTNLAGANLSRANLAGADLSGANLAGANLSRANMAGADLSGANLYTANLIEANLRGANLRRANLRRANLHEANLAEANLTEADLTWANLHRTNLHGANLTEANLRGATLLRTMLDGVNLASARVYGVSVWDVTGTPASQTDLIITAEGEAVITVDDLKVAQFIYLLLDNPEVRDVIDTVSRKAVLILGRFTPERKAILDGLRDALRQNNYVPILFDFDKPKSRDLTETVRTLAHLSRFVIADLTDPKSIPQELQAIVPDLAVPVAPILSGDRPYGMFTDLQRKYHWVLDVHQYNDLEDLLETLIERVIQPAEAKAQELSD